MKRQSSDEKIPEDELMIEMSDLKKPINDRNSIYSPNALRKKLNNEVIIPIKMETNRSISSLKEFKPDKLVVTNRTGRTNNNDPSDTKRSL